MTEDIVERVYYAYANTRYGPLSYIRGEYIPAIEREAIEAALAAIRETHAIVPREPSEAMIEAGGNAIEDAQWAKNGYGADAFDCFKAMIAAAEGEG